MTYTKADKIPTGPLSATQRLMARGVLLLGLLSMVGFAVGLTNTQPAEGDAPYTGTADPAGWVGVPEHIGGELEITRLQRDRATAILGYATRYRASAELSTLIYDIAVREGLDPELGFRLVKVESNFNPRAISSAAAIGLAQVQLATARFYDPAITTEQLMEPERNLVIGFRYLRDLMVRYGLDIRTALEAYNAGPSKLQELRDRGERLETDYVASVMIGYPRQGGM